MIKGKRVLALIPARGGSKGIKDKNIKLLCDKPLIAHTIEAALESNLCDAIVVTTDSEGIAEIARKYGARAPFLRPSELAMDTSKTLDAVRHAIKWLEEHHEFYDIVVLLQPTSPLRTSKDVRDAIEQFIKFGQKSLASVSETQENPLFMRTLQSGNKLTKMIEGNSTLRRQELLKYYKINGAIYINLVEEINEKTSFNDNLIGYIMEPEESIDIDNNLDFSFCEFLLAHKENGKTRDV